MRRSLSDLANKIKFFTETFPFRSRKFYQYITNNNILWGNKKKKRKFLINFPVKKLMSNTFLRHLVIDGLAKRPTQNEEKSFSS